MGAQRCVGLKRRARQGNGDSAGGVSLHEDGLSIDERLSELDDLQLELHRQREQFHQQAEALREEINLVRSEQEDSAGPSSFVHGESELEACSRTNSAALLSSSSRK